MLAGVPKPPPTTRPATLDEWQRLWESDPTAEYYQSPAWADLWSRRTPGASLAPIMVVLPTGTSAVVPLIRQVRFGGVVSRLMSNPTGSWTGWLSSNALTDDEAADVVNSLGRQHGLTIDWRSTPLQHRPGLPMSELGASHLVDLRSGPEAVRSKWSKGHKAAYKQGLREGVQVRIGAGREDWGRYHDVYLDTIARWQTAGRPVTSSVRPDLLDALRTAPGVRLWVAERAGEVLAGAIFLYARRTVVYWSGAYRAAAAALRPSNVVLGTAMLEAAGEGAEWLDLGDSGIHQQVADFKRRFGAVRLPYGIFRRRSMRMRLIEKVGSAYASLRDE